MIKKMNIFLSNEYYGNEHLDQVSGNDFYVFDSNINHLSVFDGECAQHYRLTHSL